MRLLGGRTPSPRSFRATSYSIVLAIERRFQEPGLINCLGGPKHMIHFRILRARGAPILGTVYSPSHRPLRLSCLLSLWRAHTPLTCHFRCQVFAAVDFNQRGVRAPSRRLRGKSTLRAP